MITLLIHNATLLSFQDGFNATNADAIAFSGNTIAAIGSFINLKALITPQTQVIDAQGKTLMPGFNDSHIHIWKVGNLKTFMLDVRGTQSMAEMLGNMQAYLHNNAHLQWLTARGFNEAAWQEGRMPTKHDLDKVSTSHPIYLIRTCAHIAVCNSIALEICGITAQTPVPAGGVVYVDGAGEPTGVLAETALGLITEYIPPYSKSDLKIMVQAARAEMYHLGITAVTDPAVDPLLLEAYHEMNAANELGFRLNALPMLLADGSTTPFPMPQLFSSPFFTVNTVKFFADGGLSGKTSALKRPYNDTDETGVLRLDAAQYIELCTKAMMQGLGVASHAIGDAAIEFVIDVYKKLHQYFPNTIKRIEHLGLPEPQHLHDMATHQIACSMQTIFLDELGKNFIRYIDADYLSRCYPAKSVLDAGVLLALSSDAPVVKNFNPFKGIQAAITRQNSMGEAIAPQESITVAQALKAYTYNAAKIGGLHQMGSLEIGMLADCILLSHNPLTTPVEALTDIQVTHTFVDGKLVYER